MSVTFRGRCRVIEGGLGDDYFSRRLDDFERFYLGRGGGATALGRYFYWG